MIPGTLWCGIAEVDHLDMERHDDLTVADLERIWALEAPVEEPRRVVLDLADDDRARRAALNLRLTPVTV